MENYISEGRYWQKAWSLVEGCTPISEGCLNCWSAQQSYMRFHQKNPKMRARYEGLTHIINGRPTFNGTVRLMSDDLKKPEKRIRPTVWAIWNDLFHEALRQGVVEWEKVFAVYDVMMRAYWHTFLVLTKRPQNALEFYNEWTYPNDKLDHIYLGVTAENQDQWEKRKCFLQTPAAGHFVSAEPLLGPIDFGMSGKVDIPDCIIASCESGPKRRPAKVEWFYHLKEQCVGAGIPFFLKQMEVSGKVVKMPYLSGRQWNQLPW